MRRQKLGNSHALGAGLAVTKLEHVSGQQAPGAQAGGGAGPGRPLRGSSGTGGGVDLYLRQGCEHVLKRISSSVKGAS